MEYAFWVSVFAAGVATGMWVTLRAEKKEPPAGLTLTYTPADVEYLHRVCQVSEVWPADRMIAAAVCVYARANDAVARGGEVVTRTAAGREAELMAVNREE